MSLNIAAAAFEPELADQAEPDTIVVVASRIPQPRSDLAAQVTVIDAEQLRRDLVEDLDGMLKYEPGLDMQTSGTRFGASSVNIRGLAGNRVDIEIDGVPMRDQFIIGAYSNAGRALVEADRVRRVEVLYGPASAMYGSDAMGGVMAISTWDPADLLARTSRRWWLAVRGGYQGMDDSWVASGVSAVGEGPHGLLAAATRRSGHALDHQAPDELAADMQDWGSRDYAFRYTFETTAGSSLRLSADRWERDTRSRIESLLGYGPRFRSTTSLVGDDSDETRRLFADFDFTTRNDTRGTLLAYSSSGTTDQWTDEERAASARPVAIQRRFTFDQDLYGIKGFAFRDIETKAARHRVGLGADWRRSEVREMRDGLQTNLRDGSATNMILGETMPVRDFPNSRTEEYGLWLQDQIELGDGRWELSPALRWDSYDLDPRPDPVWIEDNPNTPVVSMQDGQVTPRLGAVYHGDSGWNVYGQYAEGFRAPPYEDANIGFEIPLFGFRAIPNPDLRPESSTGIEVGVRRFSNTGRLSLAAFRTDYDDFIESRVMIGRDPLSGDLVFQSRNLDRARIQGLDLRLWKDLAAWSDQLQGWSLELAAYWARGEDRGNGEPLNSIAPPQAVLGIAWSSPDEVWDAGITGTITAAKHADDIDESVEPRYATAAWATLDLSAGWRPRPGLELRAALFNLTNENYWRWLDVANLEADNPAIPLLSRPGRSGSFSIAISF